MIMSKKEFINAILRGDKVEAMEIKNKMSNNSEHNTSEYYAIPNTAYETPMNIPRTPEQAKAFEKFKAKTEKEYPNMDVTYYTVLKLEPM